MTSLRGPDPYGIAEERLARLAARRSPPLARLCAILHEAVPTYTWVGLARPGAGGARVVAQAGAARRVAALSADCAALLAAATTLVVPDVAASSAYRGCFPEARALLIGPVGTGLILVVASEHRGAFGLADRALLALVARSLGATPDAGGRGRHDSC